MMILSNTMNKINTDTKFKICEDETFNFNVGQKLFLTLIETDSNKFYVEITNPKELIGRRLIVERKNAFHTFSVFRKQLISFKYHSEVLLFLNNSFSYKTLRETVFAATVYDRPFNHQGIYKLREAFNLDYQLKFDDDSTVDKTFEPVSVIVNFSGKSKSIGYWRGPFCGQEYRFHFYP